jgi:MFS family permease
VVLAGCVSFLVGNAYNAQLPGFAADLDHGDPGLAYSMLLAADAAGGLLAGVVLESMALLRPARRMAIVLALLWCCALVGFAVSDIYAVALALLFAAGFLELTFNAMAQTLVQLNAHQEIRGRTLGLFNMASLGLRAFSGITVGLIGSMIGFTGRSHYRRWCLLRLRLWIGQREDGPAGADGSTFR